MLAPFSCWSCRPFNGLVPLLVAAGCGALFQAPLALSLKLVRSRQVDPSWIEALDGQSCTETCKRRGSSCAEDSWSRSSKASSLKSQCASVVRQDQNHTRFCQCMQLQAQARKGKPKKIEETPQTKFTYKQSLYNFQNVQYYADFNIGGQTIAGIFDTGSFELLVRSSRCSHCVHPTPPYDHKKSDTYEANGTITKHVFGSGPCISVMGYESVSVGPDFTYPKQAFWEIVDHRIRVMDTAKFAAIVGIGPSFGSGSKTEKTLLMNYGVDHFSICLQRESGKPGFLTWNPDREHMSLPHATAKVIGEHHWVTHLHNVSFINKQSGHLSNVPCGSQTGCAAIIDSGTSLIAAPALALMQLGQQIPAIKEDCSNIKDLPDLHFVVDGVELTLPPQAYVMRITGATLEAEDIWDILFFRPKIRKLNICMPAFMQLDMMSQFGPVWILGMPFFRFYYSTFVRSDKVMHFHAASPCCDPQAFEPKSTRTNSSSKHEVFLAAKGSCVQQTDLYSPMDIEVSAMIPPTLSGMIDHAFNSNARLSL